MNSKIVKDWIASNAPLGLEKLAVTAQVSSSTIRNMLNGRAPKNRLFRRSIASVLGAPEQVLFPDAVKKSA